jgi:PHP family Zn ribbon phosphoesterase
VGSELEQAVGPSIANAIQRMREGKLHIVPGYDGLYGKIEMYSPQEREMLIKKPEQLDLF